MNNLANNAAKNIFTKDTTWLRNGREIIARLGLNSRETLLDIFESSHVEDAELNIIFNILTRYTARKRENRESRLTILNAVSIELERRKARKLVVLDMSDRVKSVQEYLMTLSAQSLDSFFEEWMSNSTHAVECAVARVEGYFGRFIGIESTTRDALQNIVLEIAKQRKVVEEARALEALKTMNEEEVAAEFKKLLGYEFKTKTLDKMTDYEVEVVRRAYHFMYNGDSTLYVGITTTNDFINQELEGELRVDVVSDFRGERVVIVEQELSGPGSMFRKLEEDSVYRARVEASLLPRILKASICSFVG
jgi:hypothetical protein